MSNEPKRKVPLDLHIKCGCGGVFSLELDQHAWSLWGQYMVETSKAWIQAHAFCQKRGAPTEESLPGKGEG